jgi:hypothetical protein
MNNACNQKNLLQRFFYIDTARRSVVYHKDLSKGTTTEIHHNGQQQYSTEGNTGTLMAGL